MTYREHSIACPACTSPLQPIAAPTTPGAPPAYGCTACGGAWLGNDALIHLMKGVEDSLATALTSSARTFEAVSTGRAPTVHGTRACPMCTMPMSRFDAAGVELDNCPAHGTWFDRNEVARVASASQAIKNTPKKGSAYDTSGLSSGLGGIVAGSALDAAGAIAGGTARISIGILGLIFGKIIDGATPD